ncbi:MAG: HTH domain-containing protein [Candidatus Pacebacteria bacterium]|nr:HTH domain-containing protein [Candidatus Paceibacterota bacterium]
MLPKETRSEDVVGQNTDPIDSAPEETPVEPVADPEHVLIIEPEVVEQPQRSTDVVEEKVVGQITSEPALAIQTSAPKQPTLTPEQQPQIQERIIYKTDPNIVQRLLVKARAKIQERKRKKLDKVMVLFEAKPQITNKDIQKLLRISSATAVRYLDILEAENRIKQVGNTGKSVFYTKV